LCSYWILWLIRLPYPGRHSWVPTSPTWTLAETRLHPVKTNFFTCYSKSKRVCGIRWRVSMKEVEFRAYEAVMARRSSAFGPQAKQIPLLLLRWRSATALFTYTVQNKEERYSRVPCRALVEEICNAQHF